MVVFTRDKVLQLINPCNSGQQIWQAGQEAIQKAASLQPSRHHPVPHLSNLVLVPCHAVFIGTDYSKAEDPDSWLLLDYQMVL